MAREQQQEEAAGQAPGLEVPAARPGQNPAATAGSQGEQHHQQSAADIHASLSHRLARSPFGSFIPWILFWVIGGPSTWETAAIAALLAAVLLTLLSIEKPGQRGLLGALLGGGDAEGGYDFRRVKLLDAATVLFFAALVVVSVVTSRHDVSQLDKYSQALSSGALGLIALGSIVFGHPFTIDYAKESTPPEVWGTPVFKHVNLVLTAVWTVVFLVCGVLGLLAVHAHTKGVQDWLNWYIPIVLIVIGIRLNTWYPHRVRARLQQRRQPSAASD
jgi:hypothetical protein